MAFSPAFLDELTARNDIVDVVSSYVHLVQKGSSYFGLCPFHNEKTGSFHVEPSKQIYHCFGCKKGGGVINFIMEIENLSYPDAVRFLAKRVNLEMPEEERNQAYQSRQKLLDLNKDAARYFYDTLLSEAGKPFRAYLDKRQISKATAQNFGIGASDDSWDGLIRAMTAKGYTKEQLLDAGLVSKSNKSGGLYDKFRNRLMFPVIDARGDILGFTGRVLDGSDPKYMNTPETSVYSKRYTLYGIHLAKKTKRPNIILCEGNVDVIQLHQAGFDNAVANMGTALTVEQTRLLSRYTKELILCYDNDKAGTEATNKALDILKNSEFTVKVLNLPQRLNEDGNYVKQDPDDFIKYQGKAAFEAMLTGSNIGTDFQLSQIQKKYNLSDDEQRILFCKEAALMIAGLRNSVEREVYAHRVAQLAKISPEAMKLEMEQVSKKRAHLQKKQEEKDAAQVVRSVQPKTRGIRYENVRSARAEEGLIRLLLLDDTLFDGLVLPEEEFSSPVLRKVFFGLMKQKAEGTPPQIRYLTEDLTSDEMSLVVEFSQKPESLGQSKTSLRDYLRIIHEEYEKRIPSDMDPLLAAKEKFSNKKRKK